MSGPVGPPELVFIAGSARRGRRLLPRAWRIFWIAAILVLFAFWIVSEVTGRQLARELRGQRVRGELMTIEEVIPRLPPGAKNAADDYRRALAALVPGRHD